MIISISLLLNGREGERMRLQMFNVQSKNRNTTFSVRRHCSDFTDMLRRLIKCRIIIIIFFLNPRKNEGGKKNNNYYYYYYYPKKLYLETKQHTYRHTSTDALTQKSYGRLYI